MDIVLKYEKEKEYLDKLLKQFMDLTQRFKEYEKNNEISNEIIKEKEKFEDDFVRLNCEIQQIRSDNEGLLDEIKVKNKELNEINDKIKDKSQLIQIIEQRITELQDHRK